MKKHNHLILTLLLILATLFVSCKKVNQTATVVKDCTGTYLRVNGKDYHVCNREKVSSFSDGTTVNATFKKIKDCNGSAKDQNVCQMIHENEGWIEVVKIQ